MLIQYDFYVEDFGSRFVCLLIVMCLVLKMAIQQSFISNSFSYILLEHFQKQFLEYTVCCIQYTVSFATV